MLCKIKVYHVPFDKHQNGIQPKKRDRTMHFKNQIKELKLLLRAYRNGLINEIR